MATYKIEDNAMCGYRYQCAIENMIIELNDKMGTDLFYYRDWAMVHELAKVLGVTFDDNGEIVR